MPDAEAEEQHPLSNIRSTDTTMPSPATMTVRSPQASCRNSFAAPAETRRPPRQHSSISESGASASATLKIARPSSSQSLSSLRNMRKQHRELSSNVWISPNFVLSDPRNYLIHLVCEESLGSHEAEVVECKFSPCGAKVASFDAKGCLKIWKGIPPVVKLVSMCTFPSRLTCLAWIPKENSDIVCSFIFWRRKTRI